MKYNYYNLIIITVIFIFHFILINPLEKSIVYGITDSNIIRRPEKKCINGSSLECLGMPSGHSECIVIICLLLFKLKLLSLPTSILIILGIGLQRIFANRHTLAQVIAGWSIGLVYSIIYLNIWKHYSISYAPLFSILLSIALILLNSYLVDSIVNQPVPKWVPDSLLPILKKKKNVPYINKIISSLTPIVYHYFTPVYSWTRLEYILDTLFDKIISNTPKIDVIVGIKSGGAIISSYIHTKMPDKPLYFFKIKKTNRKDTISIINMIEDWFNRHIYSVKDIMETAEGIDADISNKHVLLLDETVASGQSMLFVKEYLEKEKHVASVTLATININNHFIKTYINEDELIYYSKTENATIYPWGYDN